MIVELDKLGENGKFLIILIMILVCIVLGNLWRCFDMLCGVVVASNCVKFVFYLSYIGCLKAVKNRVEVWVKTGFKTQIFVFSSYQSRGMGLRAAALIKENEAEPLYTRAAAWGPRHWSSVLAF